MNGKWVAGIFGLILALLAILIWLGGLDGIVEKGRLKEATKEAEASAAADAAVQAAALPLLSSYPDTLPLGQLPEGVAPTHYALDLTLVPEADGFDGQVAIDVEVSTPTDHIFIHAEELDLKKAELYSGGELLGEVVAVQEGTNGETRLTLPEEIGPGTYQLQFVYHANYSSELDGIYKVTEDGTAYLTSQMETISARRAFPSFDEPRFKVPFEIAISAPEGDVVVTNTPEESSSTVGGGLVRHVFKETKPLPTYLLAFVVGPYDVEEWPAIPPHGERNWSVPLRGIATKGNAPKTRQMLAVTQKIIEAYEDAFDAPYPYAKLDLIAVPDYAFGAMENAGAIVFREQILLLDENSSVDTVRRATGVLAHEVAHQWFGDLVTPRWWNDAWLNESFATWAVTIGGAAAQPDFGFDTVTRRNAYRIMAEDQRGSVRPIRLPIESTHDIVNAFDGISYSKGAAVLSMFENYVGRDAFMAGVRLHFKRYAFGVATFDDFVKSLADGSGRPEIIEAFDSFVLQPGLPIVDFDVSCTSGRAQFLARQRRFSEMGDASLVPEMWQIPICYRKDDEQNCFMMTEAQTTVALGETCPATFMPNAQSYGYYRWSLDAAAFDKLIGSFDQLPFIEGLSVADNLVAWLNSGSVSFEQFVTWSKTIAASEHAQIADAPIDMLTTVSRYAVGPENQPAMAALASELYGERMDEIGLIANTPADLRDPAGTADFRKDLAEFMAFVARDSDLRAQLKALGEAAIGYGTDQEPLAADVVDLRHLALAVALQEDGPQFSDALVDAFKASNDGIFRDDVLYAWARSEDPVLARDLLDEVTLADWVRQNESNVLVERMLRHKSVRAVAWDWLASDGHVRQLALRLPNFARGKISSLGDTFCNAEARDGYEALMSANFDVLDGGPRVVAQGVEEINHCIAFRQAIEADVAAYLSDMSGQSKN